MLDRQLDALRAAGCVRVFDDRSSGTSADRLGLKACLDHLRSDVVLVVLDLGRLGRLVGERAGRCLRGPACPLPYRRPRHGVTAALTGLRQYAVTASQLRVPQFRKTLAEQAVITP